MRYIIFSLMVLLAGCNGSSDNDSAYATTAQLPPNESTSIAALRAEVATLQASLAKLQLIGQVHGTAFRTAGISGGNFLPNAVNFGPCTDMGVLVGFTGASNSTIADPLYAKYQAFKQCTGFSYETDVSTGELAPASRLYWDGPNCTGKMWEWAASGSSFNEQSLTNGVVFLNPADMSTQLMVTPGQTPIMVQAASVYIVSNGDCEADGDLQLMWAVSANDVQITGIPGNVGKYQLAAP